MSKSQVAKLYELLNQNRPIRTDEIQDFVYGSDHLGLARVGARIWDIKKKFGIRIEGWKDKNNPSLYWYALIDNRWADRFLFFKDLHGSEMAYTYAKTEWQKAQFKIVEEERETIKLI